MNFDKRHGGPYDRGSADAYYGRAPQPHYYVGATMMSARVETLTDDERAAYFAGYNDEPDRKDWGSDDWAFGDDDSSGDDESA